MLFRSVAALEARLDVALFSLALVSLLGVLVLAAQRVGDPFDPVVPVRARLAPAVQARALPFPAVAPPVPQLPRSADLRVGQEGCSRWSPYACKIHF